MPNIKMLIDSISQHLTNTQNDQHAYFLTIDLEFAYSQLQLHRDTAKYCNFNIIFGESTGTCRYKLDSTASLTGQMNSKKLWIMLL